MLISKLENKYSDRAEFVDMKGRKVVKSFGNLKKEYEALREGAMFYDCSTYGLLLVEGQKVDLFLEKLATKDIQYLNIGNISECYFLNEVAEVIGNVFIVRRENDFMVIATWEQAEDVKSWLILQAEKSEYKITILDLMDKMAMVSIEGPKSWKVVKKVFDIAIENLALRTFMTFSWYGEELILIRVGRSSEYGYMTISSNDSGAKIYVPVTVTLSLSGNPSSTDRSSVVISAPALGPSISETSSGPWMLNMMSLPVRSTLEWLAARVTARFAAS